MPKKYNLQDLRTPIGLKPYYIWDYRKGPYQPQIKEEISKSYFSFENEYPEYDYSYGWSDGADEETQYSYYYEALSDYENGESDSMPMESDYVGSSRVYGENGNLVSRNTK